MKYFTNWHHHRRIFIIYYHQSCYFQVVQMLAYFFLRSGLETELLEAQSKSEVMQRKVDLLDKEKKALSKEYEAHLVKCEESLQKVSQYPFHRCCIRTGFIFVRTIFFQKGKCSPFLELTPTLWQMPRDVTNISKDC